MIQLKTWKFDNGREQAFTRIKELDIGDAISVADLDFGLIGIVYGHPKFCDGVVVHTSRVVSMRRSGERSVMATTVSGSKYCLNMDGETTAPICIVIHDWHWCTNRTDLRSEYGDEKISETINQFVTACEPLTDSSASSFAITQLEMPMAIAGTNDAGNQIFTEEFCKIKRKKIDGTTHYYAVFDNGDMIEFSPATASPRQKEVLDTLRENPL